MKKHWMIMMIAALILLGSIGTVQAEIIPPYGEGQIGLQAVVLCETLTLRKEPSASSQAVKTLRYGDRITVQPETGGWAACFLTDDVDGSRAGWVNEEYLAIDPAWYRTEKKTPVYAWNDTMAPKVALLDENTTLPILKTEGNWLAVSLRGAAGWIWDEAASSAQTGRRDGERFQTVIVLEGMEEAVLYEHAVNTALGIEIDYDCDAFRRVSTSDCERFVSSYDDPAAPIDYFEVKRSAQDAGAVFAAISEELSKEYDLIVTPSTLEKAGSCIKVHASVIKGTDRMADRLQTVYIIPTADGCVTAAAHCTIESAEGFGRRTDYILHTLSILNGQGE